MNAAMHHIRTASEELGKLRSEVLTLEERVQTAQRTLREATQALSHQEHRPVSALQVVPVPPYRLRGFPLKTNPELCARVQQALSLETKKEAEIAVGAVIDALEQTLLNNLGIEGFSLKLGGFGKFKVRHLKATTRRLGFSGETVTTKPKRKVKFVPLGMLRMSEKVG
ncbi:MAG: HU family DNA-binding protein [Candidatus Sulfotelmatobacter sp.]